MAPSAEQAVPASPAKPSPPRQLLRVCVYSLLFVLCLFGGGVFYLLHSHPAPREYAVCGSSERLGADLGRARARSLRLLQWLYVKPVVCLGDENLFQTRSAAVSKMLDTLPKRYATELTAFANSANVKLHEFFYANFLLDMGNARGGCRSAVVASDEKLLHAHNLDWQNLGAWGNDRPSSCVVLPPGSASKRFQSSSRAWWARWILSMSMALRCPSTNWALAAPFPLSRSLSPCAASPSTAEPSPRPKQRFSLVHHECLFC